MVAPTCSISTGPYADIGMGGSFGNRLPIVTIPGKDITSSLTRKVSQRQMISKLKWQITSSRTPPSPHPRTFQKPILMLFALAGWGEGVDKFGLQEGGVGGSSEVEFCRGLDFSLNSEE